jgi:hypothetical protein
MIIVFRYEAEIVRNYDILADVLYSVCIVVHFHIKCIQIHEEAQYASFMFILQGQHITDIGAKCGTDWLTNIGHCSP